MKITAFEIIGDRLHLSGDAGRDVKFAFDSPIGKSEILKSANHTTFRFAGGLLTAWSKYGSANIGGTPKASFEIHHDVMAALWMALTGQELTLHPGSCPVCEGPLTRLSLGVF